MVPATLLRSLILSSMFYMALCSNDVPAPSSKDAMVPGAATSMHSVANSTAIPTLSTPAGLNSTTSDPTASGDTTTDKPKPDGKAQAMHGSSSIPGAISADGKCTCPGVPPVPAGPPAVTSNEQTGSTPPPVTADAVSNPPPVAADNTPGVSTNDTSSSSFIKAPTNLCLLAVSAVVGINALVA